MAEHYHSRLRLVKSADAPRAMAPPFCLKWTVDMDGQQGDSVSMSKRLLIILALALVLPALGLRIATLAFSVRCIPINGDECLQPLQAKGIVQSADEESFKAKQSPPGVMGRFPLLLMSNTYCFPLEAYLTAPIIRWLPRAELGTRLGPALLGLATCILSLLILRGLGPLRDVWPGMLLVLFPSPYLLMHLAAYGLPGYPSLLCFSALAVWLAQKGQQSETRWHVLAVAAGLCAGLTFSATLLGASLLVAVTVMACLAAKPYRALASAPLYLIGLALGLLPYFGAKRLYPGSYATVSQLVPWREALARLWPDTLCYSLPMVVGIRSTVFPDSAEYVGAMPPGLVPIWAWLLNGALVAATLLSAFFFVQRLLRKRWPSLCTWDVFAGVTWGTLLLFVLSTRWNPGEIRYILPVAWCFPFLITHVHVRLPKAGRIALAAVVALLALSNVSTSILLLQRWTHGLGGARATNAVEYLKTRGIKHCYASFFDAYTIDFITDEEIMCSQPYNERTPGWPLPYKAAVDSSTNAAFALGPSIRFKTEDLEYDLRLAGVNCHTHTCGLFRVYTDFSRPLVHPEILIPGRATTVSVSHFPEEAPALTDEDRSSRWRTHQAQEAGMWVTVRLPEPRPLTSMNIFYDGYPHDHAYALNIYAAKGEEWVAVTNQVPFDLAPFEFRNGHPIYGSQLQTFRFAPVNTDAIKIEIAAVNPGRDWTIGEIELFAAEDSR